MSEEEQIRALILQLKSANPQTRFQAADTLAKYRERAMAAVPALKEALNDKEWLVRVWAAWALIRIDSKDLAGLVPQLVKALEQQEKDVRVKAALVLGRIGEQDSRVVKNAVQPLIRLIQKDKEIWVRVEAAGALKRFRPKEAIAPLIEAMKEERNKERKYYFAIALAKIEAKEGEGIKELRRMKAQGALQFWQIEEYESLCRDLSINP